MAATAQTATRLPIKGDVRIPALDGLRALASLSVVIYHFGPHIVREPGSKFQFLHSIPIQLFQGVPLFFVLSGFLISGILVNARNSTRYFKTFYIRRSLRIFPLYYLVLAGYVVALLFLGNYRASAGRLFENPLPIWTYVFYLQNFAMSGASTYGAIWMGGSWSLAVEEQFYVTLPTLVRNVSERTLGWVAGFGLIVPAVLRAAVQKIKFIPSLGNRLLLPMALDALAAGILVMLLWRYRREWLRQRRKQVGWVSLVAFTSWIVYPRVPYPQAIRMSFLQGTADSIVCACFLLYVLAASEGWMGRFLSRSWMRTLGNMAYSTYLFHPILLCVAFQLIRGKDPYLTQSSDLFPILIAFVATMVLSYVSWKFLESKLIRWGHEWRY